MEKYHNFVIRMKKIYLAPIVLLLIGMQAFPNRLIPVLTAGPISSGK